MVPVIGVFGHYGNRNLGDEAIIQAVVEHVRLRLPHASLHCFSLDPADTASRYGVPAFHIRRIESASPPERGEDRSPPGETGDGSIDAWAGADADKESPRGTKALRSSIKRLPLIVPLARALRGLVATPRWIVREIRFLRYAYERVRALDLLIVAGSNQFLDNFGGVWGFPYTLLRWTAVASLARTKVAFLSVGAGPIDNRLSRLQVRLALRRASYFSFRDEHSRRLIARGRLRSRCAGVYPDLAHGLLGIHPAAHADRDLELADSLVVGINVMPMYDSRYWCEADAERYAAYVRSIARFATALIRERRRIFFFSTQRRDEDVIDDVLAELDPAVAGDVDREMMVRRPRSVYDLIETLHSADVVVATRYHGSLLATLAERPTLSICYYAKSLELMRAFGLESYALPFDGLDSEELLARLHALCADASRVRERIRVRNDEYRSALDRQYDCVLGLLPTELAREGLQLRQPEQRVGPPPRRLDPTDVPTPVGAFESRYSAEGLEAPADAAVALAPRRLGRETATLEPSPKSAPRYHYFHDTDPFPDRAERLRTAHDSMELAIERLEPTRHDPHRLVLMERRRAFERLLGTLPEHAGLEVLDVGGRIQPYRPLLHGRLHRYIALDPQLTGMVDVIGSGEDLPFDDASFDLVICTQVLSYVPQPHRVVAEIHRVLKPGGALFLTVPACCPTFFDERWRFLPDGIRRLTSDFAEVDISPEGHSIAGICRTANVAIDSFLKRPALRRLAAATLIPLVNVAGERLDEFSRENDQFTANYSVVARK